jgi:hypothetical protein
MALLTSVPGGIFTTLPRGTPITVHGAAAVIHGPDDRPEGERHGEWFASPADGWPDDIGEWIPDGVRSVKAADLSVDLNEPVGRSVVAWWFIRQADGLVMMRCDRRIHSLIRACIDGADMTPEQIDTLAHLVLRLAGRTP